MNTEKVNTLINQLAISNNWFVSLRATLHNVKHPNSVILNIIKTLDEIIYIYKEVIKMVKDYKDASTITTKFVDDMHITRVAVHSKTSIILSMLKYWTLDNEELHNKFLLELKDVTKSIDEELIIFNDLITNESKTEK